MTEHSDLDLSTASDRFQLVSPYQPAGDQPQAIEKLVAFRPAEASSASKSQRTEEATPSKTARVSSAGPIEPSRPMKAPRAPMSQIGARSP